MAKTTNVKKAGRPVTIDAAVTVIVRMPKKMSQALDSWAANEGMSRSEAIRKLIEDGLNRKGGRSQRSA